MMTQSSLSRALAWPYPRHRHFEEALQHAAAAWFAERGLAVHPKYPYILATRVQWSGNIIEPGVVASIQRERAARQARKQGFPLHNWIHHGLSSQAMLFNLLGPLVVDGDLSPLRETVVEQGLPWPQGAVTAQWEHEDRQVLNEDYGQPTSVDLVICDGAANLRIFIEAKLVEREFGGCSVFENGDCDGRNPATDFSLCYLHHIGRRYWRLLKEHGFLDGPIGRDCTCILATHYQFFREVLFAVHKGGTFVLLSDERSPTFHCQGPRGGRGLMPFLTGLVPEPLRCTIGSISVQQVVQAIKRSGRHRWIEQFERKYSLA